jgi:hypothetical protein
MSTRRFDALAVSALIAEIALLYRKVLRLWWTFDDLDIIHLNSRWSAGDLFTKGGVWTQQLFTPLLNVAFKMEQSAFGLETREWYIVQLAVACVAAIAVYIACRMFIGVFASWSAAALFVAAPAMCSVVTQLSTVHYLIAIVASAAAVAVFADRRQSFAFATLSAALYLAAMLAKEVAIPLPIVLAFLPGSRRRLLVPHAIALAVYFLWRRAVIGAFFGAYGWVIEPAERLRLALTLPWRAAMSAAGAATLFGMMLFAAIAAVIVIANARNRAAHLLLIASFIVAIAPLLPVAKEMNRRYVLVPSLAVAIAFAASVDRMKQRRAMLLLAPVVAILLNRLEWRVEFSRRHRMSNEARAFVDLPPNGILRLPIVPPALMPELRWLKPDARAAWFFDDCYLCSHGLADKRVWQFDPASRQVREITPQIAGIAKRFCSSIRNDKPMTVRFSYRNPALHWTWGPYVDGTYTGVLDGGLQAFVVPAREALNLPGAERLNIRVRYDSPEGWTTYSPEFKLDFVHHPDVTWTR